ncbi:unnamed protein product [Mytilus coruscus]|uniref:Uncharacterized protein n=1 Tax=Mytilus coruscus TaxID=42192 RepID=A0A6J8EXM4_MYTCO|nr:unnamed protein product [Mytilus coruscus]
MPTNIYEIIELLKKTQALTECTIIQYAAGGASPPNKTTIQSYRHQTPATKRQIPTRTHQPVRQDTKIGKFSEIIENSISSEITDDTIQINSIDKGTQNNNNEAKYIEIAKSLNFNFSNSDLTTEQKQKLMVILGTNRDVFAINLSELGCTDLHPHRIDTGDAAPVRQRFYRQSPAMKTESSKHIKEMLDNNIIEPSQRTVNGNADALSRRPYGTEIVTITTATVESSTQTEATFIELDPYASICEITTSPKEKNRK